MSNLHRFDPFLSVINPLFTAGAPKRRQPSAGFSPRFEVLETSGSFELVADLPGVSEDVLEISVEGRELSVSGSRTKPELAEGDALHLRERAFGSFSRRFTLPDEVDAEAIAASLEHGVLTLKIPKLPETQARKIPIRTRRISDTA